MKIYCNAIILASVAWFCADADAINKCQSADGKTIYTDTPCPQSAKASEMRITVRPDQATPTANNSEPLPPTPVKTDAQNLKDMQAARKIREMTSGIEAADREIIGLTEDMDRDMEILRRRKRHANNNLAGATWEQSISVEMQAIANSYGSKIRAAKDRKATMQSELDAARKK